MTTTACRDNPDGGDAERDAPLTAEEWERMDAWIAAHQFRPSSADFSSDPSVSMRRISMARPEARREYGLVMIDESGPFTLETLRRATIMAHRIMPAYVGGRSFFGAPLEIQRARFQFIPHLIRNLRNTL